MENRTSIEEQILNLKPKTNQGKEEFKKYRLYRLMTEKYGQGKIDYIPYLLTLETGHEEIWKIPMEIAKERNKYVKDLHIFDNVKILGIAVCNIYRGTSSTGPDRQTMPVEVYYPAMISPSNIKTLSLFPDNKIEKLPKHDELQYLSESVKKLALAKENM